MKKFILVLTLCFGTAAVEAQTMKYMDSLADAHQACLDNGINMLGCSQRYYKTMDSILNIAYNKLKNTLTTEGQAALKQEQLKWLKKRDAHHAAELKEYRKNVDVGESGTDMFMIVYDNDAEFVRDRVIELINRYINK